MNKFKCMACKGTGVDSSEGREVDVRACVTCGGLGFVCEEEEHKPDERDELDKWVFESRSTVEEWFK